MPICIPKELPAFQTLAKENIFVMDNERASHQDIRPLRVLLLNLMPKKIETECQFLRLLSNTPIQVNIEFLQVSSHVSKNTTKVHLESFYHTFSKFKRNTTMAVSSPVPLWNISHLKRWTIGKN